MHFFRRIYNNVLLIFGKFIKKRGHLGGSGGLVVGFFTLVREQFVRGHAENFRKPDDVTGGGLVNSLFPEVHRALRNADKARQL